MHESTPQQGSSSAAPQLSRHQKLPPPAAVGDAKVPELAPLLVCQILGHAAAALRRHQKQRLLRGLDPQQPLQQQLQLADGERDCGGEGRRVWGMRAGGRERGREDESEQMFAGAQHTSTIAVKHALPGLPSHPPGSFFCSVLAPCTTVTAAMPAARALPADALGAAGAISPYFCWLVGWRRGGD